MSDYWKKKMDELNQKSAKSTTKSTKKSSNSSDYWGNRMNELNQSKKKKKKKDEDDIAPVRTTVTAPVKEKDKDEEKGFDFFQKGVFSDGYQFGDVSKAILGTGLDVGTGVVKGAAKLGGGIVDAGMYGVAAIADKFGNDKYANELRVKAQENVIDNKLKKWDEELDKYSVLGKTGDAIPEGLGQVGTVILTGGLAGAAGFGAVGATAATTGVMGASSIGSGMSEAYQSGATDEEAATYGLVKGVVDAGSELLFGGFGKAVKAVGLSRGLSSADDVLARKLSEKVTGHVTKSLVQYGVKASAEGVEEVIAGVGSAMAKQATYMDDKELYELLEDENLLEQFVVGAVTSGVAQSGLVPGMQTGSLKESIETGRDFISGLSVNEQKVIDKELENRIAEAEQDGKKLSRREKDKLYNAVVSDMEKGYISTDTIEEVLGGDTYKSYKDIVDSEDALAKEYDELGKKQNATLAEQTRYNELHEQMKNKDDTKRNELKSRLSEEVMSLVQSDRLSESYNERSRRGQAFEVDVAQYDEKQRDTIQRAIDSGILNNTNRTHEFVDMIAKITADKGVSFDFTNNEKLKGTSFAVDGKTVNGFVTKDGVTLNIDSTKSLNSVVGHEITHVLEGTEVYTELQDLLFRQAKTKGEYTTRLNAIEKLYEGVEGADAKAELTADLVGDYLFTDADFVHNLSTSNQNLFQKVYDEIKYLCKVATAGSKEARELEKVKRAFEKAYKADSKAGGNTKYSMSDEDFPGDTNNEGELLTREQVEFFKDSVVRDENGNLKRMYHGTSNGGHTVFEPYGKARYGLFGVGSYFTDNRDVAESYTNKGNGDNKQVYETYLNIKNPIDMDAPADAEAWRKALPDVDFPNSGTNEQFFRAMEEDFRDMGYARWEAAETALEVIEGMGHDGITHIGGGRFNKADDTRHRVYIAFQPEQVKYVYNTKPTENPDIRYSLTDSDGKQLSKEQQEYFKDSKVRNENGNLKVMYHGTPNGEFTVFKDGTYFTDNKEYADRYQSPSASSISSGKVASAPKTFEVYLDIKKPFDIADAEAKNIYINEYIKGGNALGINPYLSDAEYDKITSIDWTEGEDLRDFLIENEYDYDGLVLDEGADGGYGDDVSYRGKSYVVFSPEQVKNVDNQMPTADPDIRFSLSESVEETKDLIALHNLQSSELMKTLDLGGLPMPSIAVIKSGAAHEQYGDVSLILPKETIDPKANKDNKVYGGDAWTPTYPKIEYKPNEKVEKKISDKYYELAKEIGYDGVRPMYRYVNELEDSLNRDGGEAAMLEKLYEDTDMMNVYLQDSGKGKVEPIVKETVTEISEVEAEMNQFLIDAMGEDLVKSFKAPAGENPMKYRVAFMEQHETEIRDAYKRYFMEEHAFTQEEADNALNNTTKRDLMKIMREAYMFTQNKGVTVKTETDYNATKEAIRTAAADGYKEWIDSLFKGVQGKSGIRNNQDYYTRSGNPRSWDALHWENTLENVVKVMKSQEDTGTGSFSPFNDLFSKSHKQYGSIAEIKADSDRLTKIPEDEYEAMKETFSNRFIAIATSIKDPAERNSFIALDHAAELIVDAVRTQKTKAGMLKYLQKWNSRATAQTVDDVVSLMSDIANMPTGYFEAKPKRAVGLDEVGVFVIPNNADANLKQELLNRGYSIAEYDPNVEGDRQRVVNGFEEYKFSLSSMGEQGKSYGNYNVSGKDIALAPTVSEMESVDNTTPNTENVLDNTDNVLDNANVGNEMKPTGAIYNMRDGENGWGNAYATAQEALNDAVRVVNRELWNDFNEEIDKTPRNKPLPRGALPITNALVSVQEDVRQETITPIQGAQLLSETYKSGGVAALRGLFNPHTGNLYPKYIEQAKQYETAAPTSEVAPVPDLFPDDLAPVSEPIPGQFDSLTDADAPPEMDAPYYEDEDSGEVTVDDPLDDRTWEDVGKRNVNAYMYENPEVKPFFQQEAAVMLRELRDSTKGQRIYSDVEYLDSSGTVRQGLWQGQSRHTSNEIAYLLDKGYSYAEIENGLKAIIEDNGKENNACSKRIEFALNDRLKDGYTDMDGRDIPPDEGYLALLEEKQITEYNKETFDALVDDVYAPPVEETVDSGDIAPVAAHKVEQDEYSITEPYEAIRPKREKEPRMARATPEEQARAEILTEEPEVPKKQRSAWSMVKNNVLDKGMVFEDLSLATGNRELQAKFNSTRYAEARAQRFMEQNLKPIVETVEKSGKVKQFYEYLYHMHNADRMTLEDRYADTENKPVFGYGVTADVSKDVASKLEQANPEFKQWAESIYAYNRLTREMLVDGGIISKEIAELWEDMYPHYVPVRRKGDEGLNINVPLDTGRTGVNAPIKRATGGNRDILPLFDTMAMRTEQTYKAIAKNRFGVELKNTLGTTIGNEAVSLDETIDSIDGQDSLLQEGKNGQKPTFTVFENGERVTFEITEEMYDAMKPKSKGLAYTNKTLNKLNNLRRGLLTEYNPAFMLTNPIKDTQDVLVNSQHPAKTYANYPKAIMELAGKKGHWYQEYMENGGEQNTYFDGETNTFVKEKSGLSKAIGFPLEKISEANNFIERIPRMAEYIASRKEGRSIDVAMLDAARVTTNFAAGGDLTKALNRNGFTFLNASVQGFMQNVRNFREAKANGLKGWATLAAKFAVAGLPSILLNHLMWEDDEEYEELSDYVKQNYYVVGKFGDGNFVRIPKGRTLAVIQNAFEQMENFVTGNDDVDLGTFADLVMTNLAPSNPAENNLIAPIMQVAKNETWYGDDMVPSRLQNLPAAEQFDESTDRISKWLGEKLNYSPVKINYLLDQYSGAVGDMFLPMLTPEAERVDNTLLAPITDKFTTDSVMKNQNVSDFYTLKDELTVTANGSNATDEDVLMAKYMNAVGSDFAKLYAEKRKIQNSDLPNAEKYAAVREIQKQINMGMKDALGSHNTISFEDDNREGIEYARIGGTHPGDGGKLYKLNDEGEWQKLSDEQVTKYEVTRAAGDADYATDGENHYRWYEPEAGSDSEPGWRKITDKQFEKQEEVTTGLNISAADYWSNKEEYDYAYEYPEKYAVAKSVGGYEAYRGYSSELYDIKADKDENGKSISGSRKEKVLDYVNGLDADYGTKIILFKSEYNADDTYNWDIIDYLNGRDDISGEEMATILKELGFTVSANGDISW